MPWGDRGRLPHAREWERIRQATKARAGGQCEAIEDGQRCTNPGSECDHVTDRHNHTDTQWLCHDHHALKTQAQAQAARRTQLDKLAHPNTRATHPGLT